jgi:hypothetical protein
MTGKNKAYSLLAVLFLIVLACNVPAAIQPGGSSTLQSSSSTEAPVAATEASIAVQHLISPSTDVSAGGVVFDVESSGTGPEKRAPYGDSYDINLLERPFLQDMTYIPDLDINTFNISDDENWHYVSIKLVGNDPNNTLGIDYAVELDTDRDGFGDFIIWAGPPYTSEWTTKSVQVFADKNHNTSGKSADKSDAPITTDGYETLVFDGSNGTGGDPDLAWVRITSAENATLQFAFKRSLAGDIFMVGVLADAGLKDATKLDYIDRFTEAEAGSSVRDKKYYPLGALYSVDNTCREAFGFTPTGDEPMLCPAQQSPGPSSHNPSGPTGCQPPGGSCPSGYYWWPDPHCACSITPYKP